RKLIRVRVAASASGARTPDLRGKGGIHVGEDFGRIVKPALRSAVPVVPPDAWKFLGIVAIVLVGLCATWTWLFPSGAVRYRLTLSVEAGGLMHRGSGVIEVSFARQGWSDEATFGMKSRVKGEAVVVDLGAQGVLFAVFEGVHPPAMVVKEFNLAPSVGSLKGETLRRLGSVSARAD